MSEAKPAAIRSTAESSSLTAMIDFPVGGKSFLDIAKPEEVFDFCHSRGFVLERWRTEGAGLRCNQFVLRKSKPAWSASRS